MSTKNIKMRFVILYYQNKCAVFLIIFSPYSLKKSCELSKFNHFAKYLSKNFFQKISFKKDNIKYLLVIVIQKTQTLIS